MGKIHVVIFTVEKWDFLVDFKSQKPLSNGSQSFEASPIGTVYNQDSKDRNNHFATWPVSNLSPWKNDQKASLHSVPEGLASLPWCLPVLLGQGRCISKFHQQNRKALLQLLALWCTCASRGLWTCTCLHTPSPGPPCRGNAVGGGVTRVTLPHVCHAWSHHAALVSDSALQLLFSPVSLILTLLVASCILMTESNGQCSLWVTNVFLIEMCCNLFPNGTQVLLWIVWLWNHWPFHYLSKVWNQLAFAFFMIFLLFFY